MLCLFASASDRNYDIDNPYKDVNWSTWKPYKTQLHCHTNASDGFLTVKEVVEKSYNLGYDAVAITDHGTLNKGWNVRPDLVPLVRLVKYERTKMAEIIPLNDEEYTQYTNPTDGSRKMLDIPLGIELNMATPFKNCHLTGYFAQYGQGLAGVYADYETPAREVKKLGGITMLAHVGEYVGSQSAPERASLAKYVNKFANIFLENPNSCVGLGINSATDSSTRHDRILYDNILKKTIPYGVVPWGFSFSDAHSEEALDNAFTMHMMPQNTMDNLRESMIDGTFFAIARYANFELPLDFKGVGSTPIVTKITVNDNDDTISVEGKNFDKISWVIDGEVIDNHTTSIDLDNYNGKYFVRFYLTGEGGICYSQPFVLTVDGETQEKEKISATFDEGTILRSIVTFLDNLLFRHSNVIKLFKKFALGL